MFCPYRISGFVLNDRFCEIETSRGRRNVYDSAVAYKIIAGRRTTTQE